MSSEKAAQFFNENSQAFLQDLIELSRIPSVSFPDFPKETLTDSAEKTAQIMKEAGFENIEIVSLPGVFPYVIGDYCHAPGAPTVLLYAHHDVQPPGRDHLWSSPAFEPTLRQGPGGLRLYGRGTADDKAGVICHTAMLASYLRAGLRPPVNLKIIIEGEEEIGSENLAKFLEKFKERLQADVMVLTDSGNFDSGVPALTVSLRGMIVGEVTLRGLKGSVHSGMWGGPVADPAMALNKWLAGLIDEEGRIAVQGFSDDVKSLTPEEISEFQKLDTSDEIFREQAGIVPGARLFRRGPSALVQTWRMPSLTVNAMEVSSRKQAGNVIVNEVWARFSVRLVPNQEPSRCAELLKAHLERTIPWGLEAKIHLHEASGPWSTDPKSDRNAKAFKAAERALTRGYGRSPLYMGMGGSIPFADPFVKALGGAVPLLVGIEDPYTNAHGENESLLVSDFQKAILSQIYLLEELAK